MKKVVISVFSGFLIANSSYAVVPSHLVDVWYKWPQSLYNADVNMEIINDPGPASTYYWSHFFVYASNTGQWSHAGYLGLQTIGNGKQAIFSVWGALTAEGTNCESFEENGAGYHCKIPYNFVEGHTYRLRTWQLTADSTGDWWGAWVRDNETNVETMIGSIKSPPNTGFITTSVLFDEYFTNVNSCTDMAFEKVAYRNLIGNGGAVTPMFNFSQIGATCAENTFLNFTGNNDFTVSSPTA